MFAASLNWLSGTMVPQLAVIPVLVGPLQTLLALLPVILVALGSLLWALLRPAGLKKLFKFLGCQKILTATLALLAAGLYTGIPWRYLHGRSIGSAAPLAAGAATDWAAFRGGPDRTAAGPAGAAAAMPLVGEPVWTFDRLPTVFSSPAIAGDRVYFSTVAGIGPFNLTGRGAIVCLDARTGREIWSYEPDDYRATFSSPAVKDGYVVCGEGLHMVRDARVTCLDLAGRKLWELRTESHVESSACIDGGRAYIGAGDDGFYCVDLAPNADGTPRVRWHLGARQYPDCESSPVVADGVVYFGLGEGGQALCAIDAETGSELWRVETPYPVFSPPTFARGKIYVGMGNGNFIQTAEEVMAARLERMREDGKSPAEIAAAAAKLGPAGEVWCIDAKSHEVDWRFKLDRTVLGAAAFQNDRLVFGSSDGYFYCISSAGQLVQRRHVYEPILSSPALAAGQVFFTTRSGRLYCLRAATLEPVWDCLLGSGASFVSSPAVAFGHVFVGTVENGLCCVGRPGTPAPPLWNQGAAGGAADGDSLPAVAVAAWHWPEAESERVNVTAPLMALGESIYAATVSNSSVSGSSAQLVKLATAPDLDDRARVQWSVELRAPILIAPGGRNDCVFTVEPLAGSNAGELCARAVGNGQIVWKDSNQQGRAGQFTLDPRRLFIWYGDNELSCLAGPGCEQPRTWSQKLASGQGVCAPLAVHDLVLAATETSVVALDDQSGVELWRVQPAGKPLFGPVAIGKNFLLATEDGLAMCRLLDGGVLWKAGLGRLAAVPVASGSHVAAVTEAGELVVLNRDDGAELRRAACSNGPVPPLIDAKRVIFLQGEGLVSLAFDEAAPTVWCSLQGFGRLVGPIVSLKGRAYCATERGIFCLAAESP